MRSEQSDERVAAVMRVADLLVRVRPIIAYAELADLLAGVDVEALADSIERLERAAGSPVGLPVCG